MTGPEVTRVRAQAMLNAGAHGERALLARTVVALYDKDRGAVEFGNEMLQENEALRACIARLRAGWAAKNGEWTRYNATNRTMDTEAMTLDEVAAMAASR